MIIYRKLKTKEAQQFWNLMNQLDYETKYMLYEPGERKEKGNNLNRLETLIDSASKDQNFLLVAEDEGKLVGYISANRGDLNRIAHTAYIVVGILKDYNNHGIGTQFYQKLNDWAQKQKITRLELTVVCENLLAKHLYEKMGFVVEGTKKNSILLDGRYVDEYYMAKLL